MKNDDYNDDYLPDNDETGGGPDDNSELTGMEFKWKGDTIVCMSFIEIIINEDDLTTEYKAHSYFGDIASFWCRATDRETLMKDIRQMALTLLFAGVGEEEPVSFCIAGSQCCKN